MCVTIGRAPPAHRAHLGNSIFSGDRDRNGIRIVFVGRVSYERFKTPRRWNHPSVGSRARQSSWNRPVASARSPRPRDTPIMIGGISPGNFLRRHRTPARSLANNRRKGDVEMANYMWSLCLAIHPPLVGGRNERNYARRRGTKILLKDSRGKTYVCPLARKRGKSISRRYQ